MSPKKETNKPLVTAGAAIDFRDSWRIFRIVSEFVEGYQFLSGLKREITILGSARLAKTNKFYKIAEELGYMLGKDGFTIITGGGPSIMEASNKGAKRAGADSVGINIQLPHEQRVNDYVTKSTGFYYFFTRKVMLTSPANAFIFFPGGFGTLDEFFEVVDNIELNHMQKMPIVLVGKEYWQPVLDFLSSKSCDEVNAFNKEDMSSWHLVETADEAYKILKDIQDITETCDVTPDNPVCQGGLDWRIFRIMAELVEGFEFIAKTPNDVTVLGTKSIKPDSNYYNEAYKLGKKLALEDYTVVTGGGPGIMEATNKGAFEHGGQSIGVNMRFVSGERVNGYLTKSIGFFFPFVRKLIISAPSRVFVFFPGGLGTMHQLFELLTLIETKKIPAVPILLYGRDFWEPLINIIQKLHFEFKTISQSDKELVKIIDNVDDVLYHLSN